MFNDYKLINEIYNFTYLCIGSKYTEEIIIAAFIKSYRKKENDKIEILKYIYKTEKRNAFHHTYETDGSVIMNILSKQEYGSRCALLLRYNSMYSYDEISKIMNYIIIDIKELLKEALKSINYFLYAELTLNV